MIRYERFITRDMLRAEPDTLWVFGDNLQRSGFGGQAKEMRGEPNAVGIPTKRAPFMWPSAFFTDDDLSKYVAATETAIFRLEEHLSDGGTVVLPADGLGTGRAMLERSAPAIWRQLQQDMQRLRKAQHRSTPPRPNSDGAGEAGETEGAGRPWRA